MHYLKIDVDYSEEKTENLKNMGGGPHSLEDKVNTVVENLLHPTLIILNAHHKCAVGIFQICRPVIFEGDTSIE